MLADFFALFTEVAAEHGRVDVIDGEDGPAAAAVWFDYTRPVPEPADYDKRLAALAGPYRAHFDALGELFATHHPHEPHWHLSFLAVHRTRQGAGLGSALMRRTPRSSTGPASRRTWRRPTTTTSGSTAEPATGTWTRSRSTCPTARRSRK